MALKKAKLIILMADDDPEDRMLVREAFGGKPVEVLSVEDGVELLEYLYCRGKYKDAARHPRPDLILLDLNMPRMDGKEALAQIKADTSLRSIPAIILTTSQQECDVRKCYEMGANTYIVKPLSYDKLVESMDSVHLYWTNVAKLPAQEARSNCKNGAGIA